MTHVTFDPETLTEEQERGLACVVCGLSWIQELMTTRPDGTRHITAQVDVGLSKQGAPVFACYHH